MPVSSFSQILKTRFHAASGRCRKTWGSVKNPDEGTNGRLLAVLAVGGGGWHLDLRDKERHAVVREVSGRVELPIAYRDGNETHRQLNAAIGALGPEEIVELDGIELKISDPQIEVLDNRLFRGGMSDRESAARLARDVLGCEQAAFDVCNFGPYAESRILAAVPLERVRDYLAEMGDLAVKVRAISPIATDVIAVATGSPDEMVGALEIGSRHSQLVLAEARSGAIVQRVIPIGVVQLAERLAKMQSLPEEDAAKILQTRDMFAASPRTGGDGSGRQGRAAAAVLECAELLAADLIRTIEDFAENRLAPPPQHLVLSGCGAEVVGLTDWLQSRSGVRLVEADEVALLPDKPTLNLLRGTNEALIVQGRTHFRFRDGRFMPEEEADSLPRHRDTAGASVSEPRNLSRRGKKKKQSAFLSGRNRRALGIASGAAGLMLGILVWENVFEPLFADTLRSQNTLIASLDRSQTLRTKLGELLATHQRGLRVGNQASNKILWTEKFLAISEAIPPALWLTDTKIIQDERSVGRTDVITTKLLIRGRTTLNDQAHLSEVARFIQRLEGDKRFMSDFRQVSFEGMAPAENGHLAFELHAWYDQNKRKGAAETATGADGNGPLEGLKRQTEERNEIQDGFLRLGADAARSDL